MYTYICGEALQKNKVTITKCNIHTHTAVTTAKHCNRIVVKVLAIKSNAKNSQNDDNSGFLVHPAIIKHVLKLVTQKLPWLSQPPLLSCPLGYSTMNQQLGKFILQGKGRNVIYLIESICHCCYSKIQISGCNWYKCLLPFWALVG